MLDDAKLVKRALGGDQGAFEAIVQRYERTVFNVAYRIVKDRDDAADVTQAVFIKIYRKLGSYDPRYRFFSWLYRITVNESINHLKRTQRRAEVDCGREARGRSTPWDSLAQTEKSDFLQSALTALKLDYRVVIVLKYFLELSYKEISEIVGIPEKTVKSRLFTGRQLLRDILARQGYAR
jgi:RNA polymerase sigma-70 factor (ECF subfamily)